MYKNTAESIHDSYHRISALDNRTAEGRFGMLWSGFLLYVYIYNGSKKVQPYSNASKHVYVVVRTMDIEYSFFGHAIVPSIPNAKWNMHSQCH